MFTKGLEYINDNLLAHKCVVFVGQCEIHLFLHFCQLSAEVCLKFVVVLLCIAVVEARIVETLAERDVVARVDAVVEWIDGR